MVEMLHRARYKNWLNTFELNSNSNKKNPTCNFDYQNFFKAREESNPKLKMSLAPKSTWSEIRRQKFQCDKG